MDEEELFVDPLERYADDGIWHCRSKAEAEGLRVAIERRPAECGLTWSLNCRRRRLFTARTRIGEEIVLGQSTIFLGFTF